MTPNSVLLDTSVVIRHFRNAEALAEKLAAYEELYLPGPALAELYYGAFRSDRPQQHLDQIERFLAAADVLTPDQDTSMHYGRIAAQVARQGTPSRKMTSGWPRCRSNVVCRWPLQTSTSNISTGCFSCSGKEAESRRIQQIGTPSELRENPTNEFVRSFLEV